ncbi:MAG: hypothetical protein IPJ14_10690 [Kineosporiaceae bacterium]|nr:hypothetical protein [Kineosporiaceae bacterium]MBK7623094.1 hypothetical protein [Kineosporiaceae bacterium]MBK8074956.1 hypothetical protein [Kineosporiaceae bacterium]
MHAPASPRMRHHEQRRRWSAFLDTLMPQSDPNHLVAVAEVPQGSVEATRDCLADADLPAAFREITSRWGAEPRYQVLVPATLAARAAAVVHGH